MKPLILEKKHILKLLDINEIMAAIERSFVIFSSGKVVNPIPQDILLNHGETHVKSAYMEGGDLFCIKIASGFYGNPKIGLNSSQGMMLLFNAKTGLPKCILLEDGLLTDYRTAAAGAIAAQYLARKNSSRVLVMGTGTQARLQIEFLIKIFSIKQLFVWGRNDKNAIKYCENFSNALPIQAISHFEDAKNVDIIVTTTPSRKPILYRAEKGVHINAIGSDMPGKQELAESILFDAKIVTDSTKQCIKSGEIQHGIRNGKISLKNIYGELGDIISHKKKGREYPEEITIFDSTGLGIQDLAIAQYIFEKAI